MNMHTQDDAGKLFSLFNIARQSKKQDNEKRFAAYRSEFSTMARALFQKPAAVDPGLFALLYQMGAYDVLLDMQKRVKGETGDLLPSLAASIRLARREPHLALEAARHIQDPEQRRLRQKTAALWDQLHAPLPSEPKVHLLVLTHNRAEHVARALRELGQTAYGNYAVYIADNGSTDGTRDIVRNAKKYFPPHIPVTVEAFPVNIGRPAGHNWLLGGHDHSAADFIAIGDDDLVRVPNDWLTRMVQTAKAVPGCACVGGKALTPGWPVRVHCGVRNFTAFGNGAFELSNSDEQDDLGQFDYVDIVDHVIGCLHIFDRRIFAEAGFFDIRFSPCQCVDIEHQLRIRLAGRPIVFNGLIAFEHLRAMGNSLKDDSSLMGNSVGNVVKLLYKHQPEAAVRAGLAARRQERDAWLKE